MNFITQGGGERASDCCILHLSLGKVFWSGGQSACSFKLSLRSSGPSVCGIQHEVNRTRGCHEGSSRKADALCSLMPS